ncbi:YopX family protein [Furfurilactobacillus sp. WILCCON 0119]
MTREIKFRAWDKVQHKLMNVVEMDWEPHGTDEHGNFKREIYYVRAQNIKDFADVERYCGHAEIEELMLEQYTGLHDVNGKEIYEGDIVTTGSEEIVVTFSEQHHEEEYGSDFIYQGFNVELGCGYPMAIREKYTVIGNIHENPELLEAEK